MCTCILPFIWRIERQQIRNFKNLDYHLLFIWCWEFYFVRSLCARFSFRVYCFALSHSFAYSLVLLSFVLLFIGNLFVLRFTWTWRTVCVCRYATIADELDSIGSTVTQRRALKIREYFRIWVKVESFTTMLSLIHLLLSLDVCMCRDYTQICVQSLIFHSFTWSSIFKRPVLFSVYARAANHFGRWYRAAFFDIKIVLSVAVNVCFNFDFLFSVANRWI